MTKSSTPSKGEPRWKFIERTVAVLEHMLAPRARVQHDQEIPELISGVPRQCDVVVRYGAPPRQTLAAIVEVQDRGSQVGLQIFEGWCAKREKLGAQRLICVSCEGFTQEVESEAASMGDVVSLMMLCEPDQKPPFLATTEMISQMQVLHYRDAKVVYDEKMPSMSATCDDKVFEFPESGEKVSLYSLAEHALNNGLAKGVERCQVDNEFFDLKYRVEFGAVRRPLLFRQGEQTYSVWEVHCIDRIEEVRQCLSSMPLAYEQRNINGALGWVLLGKGTYHGKDFYTQQPFLKLPNGTIQPGPPTISKMEGHRTQTFAVEMVVPVHTKAT